MRASVAVLLAGTLLSCNAASSSSSAQGDGGACNYDALIAASDYTSSGVGAFSLTGTGYFTTGVDLGADPGLSLSAGRAFFVARDTGTIFEVDPSCGTLLKGGTFVANDPGATAPQSNPQDVGVAPDGSLWVPRYDVPSVVAIGADGGFMHDIGLTSASYDPDGNPNASAIAMASVGGVAKAFVALEVLDDDDKSAEYPAPYPNYPSLILRIDVATGTIDGQTSLVGRNPFGLFFPYDGKLWMAEPGTFTSVTETAAGIEQFDPQTQTSRLLVQETTLGGSVAEVAVTAGCGVAIIADATSQNATSLVTFDPDTGAALTTSQKPVLTTTSYDLQGMLWVGAALVVGDRSPADHTGLAHVFDMATGCTLKERLPAIALPERPVGFQAPAR